VTAAQIKGSAFLLTLQYVEANHGSAAKGRILARLDPAAREILAGVLLPIQWYPLEVFTRVLRAMDSELGRGDLSVVIERGTWAAIHDMRTVHKVLLKLVSTRWVVEKATRLWGSFHNTGRWETEALGDKGARATLFEHGIVDEAMCATLTGWMLGLLQLAGAKGTDVNHDECRARGATNCVYLLRWK
jgi:hypothetical protein